MRNLRQCFACNKGINTPEPQTVATSDDQEVFVGADCFRKVVKAGKAGYQPPKGGPRLYQILSSKAYKLTNAVFTATLKAEDLFSLAGQRIAIIRYIRTEDKVGALDNAIRVLRTELEDSGKYKDVRFQFWCDGYTSTGGSPQEI